MLIRLAIAKINNLPSLLTPMEKEKSSTKERSFTEDFGMIK
jgi:hypothetical protein